MSHLSEKTDLDTLAAKIAERMAGLMLPATAPRWLSLKQAVQYSNWGQKKLINLAADKKIYGFQDKTDGNRAWIFDRASIDSYRLGQGQKDQSEDELIGAEIAEKMAI